MKRFKLFTFLSGLLSTAIAVAMVYVAYTLVVTLIDYFSKSSENSLEGMAQSLLGFVIVPLIICAIVLCLYLLISELVVGIRLIISAFSTDKKFKYRSGFIKFSIVMDFLMAFSLMFIGVAGKEKNVLFIVVSVVELLAATFKIVEMLNAKKRYQAEKARKGPQQVNFDALRSENSEQIEQKESAPQEDNSKVNFDALKSLSDENVETEEKSNEKKRRTKK